MKARFLAAGVASGLVLLGGLACNAAPPTTTPLEGTLWRLTAFQQAEERTYVIEGTDITATFEAGAKRVTGRAGCNSYSGGYKLSGRRLALGPLASTEMFCPDPPGVMEQEQRYLKALSGATTYTIEGRTLKVTGGDTTLVFEAK